MGNVGKLAELGDSLRKRLVPLRSWMRPLRGPGIALALSVSLACVLSRLFQPGSVHEPPAPAAPEEVAEAKALRDIALEGDPPQLVVDVDYSRQEEAEWYPKNEAPLLSEFVKEGKLPPVRERIGIEVDGRWISEPLVMQGVDGIGNYGGTWTRGDKIRWISYRGAASTLLRYDVYGRGLVPHLAKACEVSADSREFTFRLRRGVRWSDGHPFTADDILYWWNWEENCKDIRSNPDRSMLIRNRPPEVLKVDDYAVKFVFPEAYGAFPRFVAARLEIANAPAHYLKRFHPTHPESDPELIGEWMAMLKTSSGVTVYTQVKDTTNHEHPRMWPWLYRKYTTLDPQSAVRNP